MATSSSFQSMTLSSLRKYRFTLPVTKRKGPALGPFLLLRSGLLVQTARDVAENVLDLVAKNDQDYDNHDRDQDEDKGVLDHTLPFLTVEQIANAVVQARKHWIHLLRKKLDSGWHCTPRKRSKR